MARLNIRYLAAVIIILRVVATLSESKLPPGEQRIQPPARSTFNRSSSTHLLKSDHNAKKGVSIPSDISRQSVGRSALGSISTSTSLSELGISDRSPPAHPGSSLTTRSYLGLDAALPLNITLQRFHAIVDPMRKAVSHYIDFWSKVIYAAANYYASLTPVQELELLYGRFKLRLTTTKGDTIDWIIVKRIAQVALKLASAGFYGWYYFICFVGPIIIAVTLGFMPANPNGVVHRIG